jgi:hypothetical protein
VSDKILHSGGRPTEAGGSLTNKACVGARLFTLRPDLNALVSFHVFFFF